ncbi:MAG: universal stress protein [Candidatus Methanoperedens sp.]|nr:universal stress protein [Candidatus Methanoperedens sp.]
MFEKVLFPTDFSEYAQKNLECIGEIPGVKEVLLLHVVDATYPSKRGWRHGPHTENANIRLEEQREHLESLGLKARAKVDVITSGDVPLTILDTANEENVSLIVLGARGKGIIGSRLLGGVSTNVMRHAKTNVLTMRYKFTESLDGRPLEKFCQRIFSKVLLPTDFSKPSMDALSFMRDMEGIHEVVLEHVVSRGETEEEIEASVSEAKKKLEDIGQEFSSKGIIAKTHVHVGDPPVEINSAAEEEDVSLIAMSRHGKGWFREMLVGSTTYDVVRNAKRPVLIVKTK